MKQVKYDVVVIGSGWGGMTAAALLTKAGYKTLVVEKLPFVGGRSATLDYHGYKINTGFAWASEECHGVLFKEVGAEFAIRTFEPLWIYRIKGKDYPSPAKGALSTMVRYAARDSAEADRVLAAFKRALAWAEPSYSMTLNDWLRQHTDNPAILGLFEFSATASAGIRISELPAGEYFRFLKQQPPFLRTTGYPPGGAGQLINALVKAIQRMGGEVWPRCPAAKIEVKDGVASGVVVRKDGEEIEIVAQAVISNAGQRRTVELAGREHFPPGHLKDVDNIKGAPQIVTYFTSDRPLLDGPSALVLTESRRVIYLGDESISCPEMAPRGKYLLGVGSYLGRSEPPYDFKKEYEMILHDCRDNIPDFDRRATLLRMNTYTGYWGLMRTWPGCVPLSERTPVERLYSVGDDSAPLGWWCSPAAIKSARLAVEDVTRRFKPA